MYGDKAASKHLKPGLFHKIHISTNVKVSPYMIWLHREKKMFLYLQLKLTSWVENLHTTAVSGTNLLILLIAAINQVLLNIAGILTLNVAAMLMLLNVAGTWCWMLQECWCCGTVIGTKGTSFSKMFYATSRWEQTKKKEEKEKKKDLVFTCPVDFI